MNAADDDPGAGIGTDEAAGPALDLSPRTSEGDLTVRARPGRKANPLLWVVLAAIVAAVGFVVFKGLSGATLYFRNVDEALEQRDELGTRRFRLQGVVVDEPATEGSVVAFRVTFNEEEVDVRSTDGLPDLFAPGEPVVMEGRFADSDEPVFLADRVLVKHDESYEADNGDRIADAEDGQTDDASE